MTWDEVDARLLQETLRLQDKPYRTRGNPSWVLKMVAKVMPKRCCICGDHETVELHHEDGVWKNYWLDNLNWYCKQHHQQADNYILHNKENTMTKTMKARIKWTEQKVASYATFCSKNTADGKTLHWCFTNFKSGDAADKYGSRYSANKGAYQKYVKPTIPTRSVSPPREFTYTHQQVLHILECERIIAAAGRRLVIQ